MSPDQLHYLGIKAIIQNKLGQVLILKHAKGYWDFPGGRVQKGEQVLDTMLREVKEETGLDELDHIQSDAMILTPIRLSSKRLGLILWYHTCFLKTEAPIALSHEHVEYLWADAHLVKSMTSLSDSVAPHIFKTTP